MPFRDDALDIDISDAPYVLIGLFDRVLGGRTRFELQVDLPEGSVLNLAMNEGQLRVLQSRIDTLLKGFTAESLAWQER